MHLHLNVLYFDHLFSSTHRNYRYSHDCYCMVGALIVMRLVLVSVLVGGLGSRPDQDAAIP